MKKSIRKLVWGVGVAVIAGILLYIILETKILASIWGVMKCAVAWFLAAKLKVWIVLIIVAGVFLITSICWNIRIRPKKPSATSPKKYKPEWVDEYTSDTFHSIKWEWQWAYDIITRKYKPVDLVPLCPEDSCELQKRGFSSDRYWHCPYCNTKYKEGPKDSPDVRAALIKHTAREKYTSDKSG